MVKSDMMTQTTLPTLNIAILIPETPVMSGVTAFLDLFRHANTYVERTGYAGVPHVEPEVYSARGGWVSAEGIGIESVPVSALDLMQVDALVISAPLILDGRDLHRELASFKAFEDRIKALADNGVPVAACCAGAFLLAATGLLDGRKATTAWWLAPLFEQHFPEVRLSMASLVERDGLFFTAGASTASYSLGLALLEQLVDEHFAQAMAKVFLIDHNRSSQRVFMDQVPLQPLHNDPQVADIMRWISNNLTEDLALESLAERFAMGKRTLIRRFKAALHDTPSSYIQKLRIDRAKRLLERTDLPLERILPELGYEDVSSFRKLFLQHTSLTPKAYREKFRPGERCCDH